MINSHIWAWCTRKKYRTFIRKWHIHYQCFTQQGYVKSSFSAFLRQQCPQELSWYSWMQLCDEIVPSVEQMLNALHGISRDTSLWARIIKEELVHVTDPVLIEDTPRYQYMIIKMHQETATITSHKDYYKSITVLNLSMQNGRQQCKVLHVAPDFYRWWCWLEEAKKAITAGTLSDFLLLQPYP